MDFQFIRHTGNESFYFQYDEWTGNPPRASWADCIIAYSTAGIPCIKNICILCTVCIHILWYNDISYCFSNQIFLILWCGFYRAALEQDTWREKEEKWWLSSLPFLFFLTTSPSWSDSLSKFLGTGCAQLQV